MSAVITRGKLIRADLAQWDGKTATYSRIDATGGTVSGLAIGNEVDVLQVFGGGTSRTRATIAAAIQHIGSTAVTLVFAPGTWAIDDDLTIPANFTCRIPRGCVFDVDSGQVLTFSGALFADSATFYSGSGTTTLSADSIIGGKLWIARTAAEVTASVSPSDYSKMLGPYVDAARYGMTADGSTDNATALANAIKVADATGWPILLSRGASYYKLASAVVQASLSGPLKIIGLGDPEIRYTGSNANYVLHIQDTNGFDVEFDGFTINANLKASKCIRVDNPSASMASTAIGKATLRKMLLKDGYMNTGITQGSSGVLFTGGYSEVVLDQLTVRNIDRDTAAGTPGSQGCAGVMVTFTDINSYCKKLTVLGGEIDTITNNEATGAGADVDCDGIIYSVPTATLNADLHVPATLIVDGTRFVNCKGRNVKSQADGFSIIKKCTVIRDLEEAINNAVEFDLQRGGGQVKDNVFYYYQKPGSGTTLGTSHSVVSYGPDQLAIDNNNADGGLDVSGNTIYNAIPSLTDTLPFFALITNGDTSRTLTGITICNNRMIGGRVNRWIKSNGGTAAETWLDVSGNHGNTAVSLIQFSATVDASCYVTVSGNKSYGGGSPVLIELADTSDPQIAAHSNFGYGLDGVVFHFGH